MESSLNRCLVTAHLVKICGLVLSKTYTQCTHLEGVGFMHVRAVYVCVCVLCVCIDAYVLIHIFPFHFNHSAKFSLNIFLRNLYYFYKEKLWFQRGEGEAEGESVRMRWEMGRYSCCNSKFQVWSLGAELAFGHNSSWFSIAERKKRSVSYCPSSEGVLFLLAVWARGRWLSLSLEFLGEGDFFIQQMLSQGSFVNPPRTSVTVYE